MWECVGQAVQEIEPFSLMGTSIKMMEIFLCHVLCWIIRDYEAVKAACCRSMMIMYLKRTFPLSPETASKQDIRHRFRSADINAAPYSLVAQNYLRKSFLLRYASGKYFVPQNGNFIILL